MQQLSKMRKRMKYFSNARAVETLIELAIDRQNDRLQKAGIFEGEALKALTAEDLMPKQRGSKKEAWARIEHIQGNDEFKRKMKEIGDSVEFWVSEGKD